jgi:predicted neuraminidase
MILWTDVADNLGVRSKPGDAIVITPVFGPETPGAYKHPASMTELAGGDLLLAYYGGSGEYGLDTAVYGARKRKGTDRWEAPTIWADTPHHSDGNAVVWQAPDGLVWLFYVVRYGDTWSTSRIKAKFSQDAGVTWSDSMMLTFEPGTMVRGRPVVNGRGEYLLPVYHETGHDTEAVGPDSTSFFLLHDPKTKTWSASNRIASRIGNIQPAVDVVASDHLLAFCRRGGGYDGRKDGFVVRSESRDGGRTWTPGVETMLPNPNAAVDFLRLASGRHALVYNDSFEDRSPLVVAISDDAGTTFPVKCIIAKGEDDFAYPYAFQGTGGVIHLVFTSNERTVVNHARMTEESVRLAGSRD